MDPLDRQLEEWGERKNPPPTDEGAIKKNVMAQLSKPAPQQITKKSPTPLIFRIAAAAALLIAGILIGVKWSKPKPPQVVVNPPASLPGLSEKDLGDLTVVAQNIEEHFPEGVQWISKINGKMVIEFGNQRRIDGDERLVITYAIQKQGKDGKWANVARHDLITWSNEPVELKDNKSIVWCHMLPDKKATVETDLMLNAGEQTLHVTANTLQAIDTPTKVMESRIGDELYRVVQTVYSI